MIKLFTYGMLTNPHIMGRNYGGYPGVLHGYKLVFARFANIVQESTTCVHGVVWEISNSDLEIYDKIEDFPCFYDRTCVTIRTLDKEVEAFCYTMQPTEYKALVNKAPTPHYLNSMRIGYNHFKLPLEQVINALENCNV